MGNLCGTSTLREAVVDETPPPTKLKPEVPDESPVDEAPPLAPPSVRYFDANQTIRDFEKLTETERKAMAETIFFETRQTATQSLLPYAPALVPIAHPSGSIRLDKPETLLSAKARNRKKIRKPSLVLRHELQEPTKRPGLQGYPGDLTEHELDQVLAFRRHVESRERTYHIMLHVYENVESEPQALCRFLRSRKFDPAEVIDLMTPHLPRFQMAHKQEFYLDIDGALGCPLSVFLTQFPFLFSGFTKTSCAVGYFKAGHLSLDGLDCITNIEKTVECYVWYALTHAFTDQVRKSQKINPDGSRCELIMVADLKGISAFNSRTFDIFGKLAKPSGSFPEILNRVVIINASSLFALTWKIIQKFLDSRTREKIEIHSNSGEKRLAELIDKKQLLAECGGDGPTYAEAVLKAQVGSTPAVTKQTTELMKLSRDKESRMQFSISAKEQADVLVFTKSTTGALVSVLDAGGNTEETSTAQSRAGGPGCSLVCEKKLGPGQFTLVLKKLSKSRSAECFLIVVQVSPQNRHCEYNGK